MRLFIAGLALLFTTSASAQSRWTLSAGPEWTLGFVGGRVRGEYDLIKPTQPLRLRLELGGYWEPSQTYAYNYTLLDGGVAGWKQSVDLTFGLSAALTPIPRARIAPYVTFGVLARQSWKNGSQFLYSGGTTTVSKISGTAGDMLFPVGVGLRARIASHMFQVEMRGLATTPQLSNHQTHALMIGTNLPF